MNVQVVERTRRKEGGRGNRNKSNVVMADQRDGVADPSSPTPPPLIMNDSHCWEEMAPQCRHQKQPTQNVCNELLHWGEQ